MIPLHQQCAFTILSSARQNTMTRIARHERRHPVGPAATLHAWPFSANIPATSAPKAANLSATVLELAFLPCFSFPSLPRCRI